MGPSHHLTTSNPIADTLNREKIKPVESSPTGRPIRSDTSKLNHVSPLQCLMFFQITLNNMQYAHPTLSDTYDINQFATLSTFSGQAQFLSSLGYKISAILSVYGMPVSQHKS